MRIKPKKNLGQNFLTDKNILQKIIRSIDICPEDVLFEIGAGRGELTEFAAIKTGTLRAFEIDRDLCRILEDRFKGRPNIEIINRDILKVDLNDYISSGKKIKILGNIPYYISTPIIERLLNFRDNIERIFITTQKEFAERIVSGSGSKGYGALSCFVQYYTEPRILFPIGRGCFRPSPKVDSCFLELKVRSAPAVKVKDEKLFFKIIRTAFNQRRKTLRNSLADIVSENKLSVFFEENDIDRNIRPERLKLDDFAKLTDAISKKE